MTTDDAASEEIDDGLVTDIAPDLMRDVIRPSGLVWSDESNDGGRRMYPQVAAELTAGPRGRLRILGEGPRDALVRSLLPRGATALPVST